MPKQPNTEIPRWASRDWVPVWDPIVRIGHWTLVAAFFTAYFTEDDFLSAHVWAGYIVGAVVLLRIVWGVIGSRHARFADFIYSPAAAVRYIKGLATGRAPRYLGHTPAGGWMILALLAMLGGTVYTGLELYAIEENAGPLANGEVLDAGRRPEWIATAAAHEDRDREREDDEREKRHRASEEFWEELHEMLANLTLLLVVLHIGGVIASSLAHRENLVMAMLTGRKRT